MKSFQSLNANNGALHLARMMPPLAKACLSRMPQPTCRPSGWITLTVPSGNSFRLVPSGLWTSCIPCKRDSKRGRR